MGAPHISVVISVKNRSEMLLDLFRGLGAQDFGAERFEVVLIDNCSTEDLAPVLERGRREMGLTIRTARTSVDGGPAPARNLGVSMAAGEVLAFTDSDCRPTPGWLSAGWAAFDSPRIAMVSGPVLAKPEQKATLTSKLTFATADEHPTFPTANLFMRTEVFRLHGGFDTTLSFRDPFNRATECADTDLAWRIIKAGHERRFSKDAVMYHEIERLGVVFWILEPTRLFLLPALVRRHPELRRVLLTANVLFYPPAVMVYFGMGIVVAAVFLGPWLLASLPVLLVLRAVQRTGSLNPVVVLRACGPMLLHLPRMVVMCAALLYGSIRFRSLVL